MRSLRKGSLAHAKEEGRRHHDDVVTVSHVHKREEENMLYLGADVFTIIVLQLIGMAALCCAMRWQRCEESHLETALAACIYLSAWCDVMYVIVATILL